MDTKAEIVAAVPLPAAEAPIIVQGLSHWFGQGEARKQALFDIDLTVPRGSLTLLPVVYTALKAYEAKRNQNKPLTQNATVT